MYYMYYRPAMLRATLSKVQLNEGKSNVTIISCKEPQQWETMRALRRRCAAHYASPLVSTTGNCTNQSLPLSPSSISLRIKFDKIPKLDKKKMDHLSKCKIARKKEIVSLKKKKKKTTTVRLSSPPKIIIITYTLLDLLLFSISFLFLISLASSQVSRATSRVGWA